MAEPLSNDSADPRSPSPGEALLQVFPQHMRESSLACMYVWSTGMPAPGRGKELSGTTLGRQHFGSCNPTPLSWLPWVLGQGCEQRSGCTYDVLGTDAEGPADDIQDLLHRDGHGSPKLRAEHEAQATGQPGKPLPKLEEDMGVTIF